jgi:hypothetical protein
MCHRPGLGGMPLALRLSEGLGRAFWNGMRLFNLVAQLAFGTIARASELDLVASSLL